MFPSKSLVFNLDLKCLRLAVDFNSPSNICVPDFGTSVFKCSFTGRCPILWCVKFILTSCFAIMDLISLYEHLT